MRSQDIVSCDWEIIVRLVENLDRVLALQAKSVIAGAPVGRKAL
jgi:hypothetical protein